MGLASSALLLLYLVTTYSQTLEPTSRFLQTLKGEPIDTSRYSKLTSDLSHIKFSFLEETVFTSSHFAVNISEWRSAVSNFSDTLRINAKWLEEFTTAYKQWHTMECTGAQCSLHMFNMAIEGSGLLHSFGLFGVRLGVSYELTDSLFFPASDVTPAENTELELGMLDRENIQEFLLIKSYSLLKPYLDLL